MKQQISKEILEKLSLQLKDNEEKVSAVLVAESKKTGKDYTYLIKAYNRRGTRIVLICTEIFAQSFDSFYYIFDGVIKPVKFEKENKKGGRWLLDKIYTNQIDNILEVSNIYHTGNCIKCNKPLTDLDSIELGMGPICRGYKKKLNRED